MVVIISLLGLMCGSFVNALAWRVHEQSRNTKKAVSKDLSIMKGRSMCPHCKHQLAAKDLVPVLSWMSVKGRCRYCHKPISWQYPVVELITAVLFGLSYAFWPFLFDSIGTVQFIIWLVVLTGFMTLAVYDLRWMLLPNSIVYPLLGLVGLGAVLQLAVDPSFARVGALASSVIIGGGLFYGLFILSSGKWIGGGDVKLGFLLGLLLADPILASMMLFLASLLGTLVALPGLLTKRLSTTTRLPFGPFLIVGCIVVYLFGADIREAYSSWLYGGY